MQKKLIEQIRKEIEWEEDYLRKIQRSYPGLPEGHLVSTRDRKYEYDYHVVQKNGKKTKKLIRTDTEEGRHLKEQLIRKRKFRHDRAAIRRNMKPLMKMAQRFEECGHDLIVFPWKTVELEEWKTEHYRKNTGYPEYLKVRTKSGELVRSKSEAFIYDDLEAGDQLFRYESELELPDGIRIYPDFIIIRKNDLKPIIWEHMGALDKPGKAIKYIERVILLGEAGFMAGDNLMITCESAEKPFTAADAERMINMYLGDAPANGFL